MCVCVCLICLPLWAPAETGRESREVGQTAALGGEKKKKFNLLGKILFKLFCQQILLFCLVCVGGGGGGGGSASSKYDKHNSHVNKD